MTLLNRRLVATTDDGFLVEFSSVVEVLRRSAEIFLPAPEPWAGSGERRDAMFPYPP